MAFNPSKTGEALNSPVERASNLNDPQFENQQGYFPYDLTHQEFVSTLYGHITPTMHLDTVPGDRTVVHDNTKLILNQINGNFLGKLNQYLDTFYVPLRNLIPNNYEKLIPNPVKGEDLPNSALPVVPLLAYLHDLLMVDKSIDFVTQSSEVVSTDSLYNITLDIADGNMKLSEYPETSVAWWLGRMILFTHIISRGQLLDYLGFQLDYEELDTHTPSLLQKDIDKFYANLWKAVDNQMYEEGGSTIIYGADLSLTDDVINVQTAEAHRVTDLSTFRAAIADILEAGKFPYISLQYDSLLFMDEGLEDVVNRIFLLFNNLSVPTDVEWLQEVDDRADMSDPIHFNISKVLAYQQVVAHYFTNDRVDNIYSSELFMQNLRSVMFPTPENSIRTTEATFEMNGVRYEYDYISYGGFWSSLMTNELMDGNVNRQFVVGTLLFLLRRSLRYGDYFSTARPNMLAVSDQLGINVDNGMVSPIDVTKNLLMQRYLNAANYIGQGFLQYMSSIYGIKPSDTGCIPRFISHRKIDLQNQITNNTAENQGAQTTNFVGYSDRAAFDVFIDDFGVMITVTSTDTLPVYKSGIDSTYRFADRFDYFNPMLQGIGDQPILSSELLGNPNLGNSVFGYTMRNAEYKYKLSKAHGAFVNSLPGYMLAYPLNAYNRDLDVYGLTINPDFIRDKPVYLDPIVPQMTGVSPAEYYHFIISCTNQVLCARKIQATPGVLF